MLHVRSRLLATTLLVGTALCTTPAAAQTTPPPADDAQPETTTAPVEGTNPPATNAQGAPVSSGGDIVITGSRIPQPNLTSASPVTVLSSQDIKLQGTTRTEDLINSLPQSFASQGSNISNGALGIATVNLRGLGVTRTLVLINGRRLQPGDPRAPVSDINFIPSALVKRVDVLTGGASSVYGADAVAGVVNFIMDTNFRGLRVDAQASTFMHYNDASDRIIGGNFASNRNFRPPHGQSVNGGAQDLAAAFGAGFDDNRGSIMAYATYRKQDAVLEASRDYSFCSLAARTAAQGGAGSGTRGSDFNCGGSATSAFSTFFTNVGTFHVDGNSFAPGQVPFNFGPYNFYQRPDERYTLGLFAEYEISPGAKPYLEAMFMNDTSNSRIAPSGDFFNTTTVNCDNPLLSAQQLGIACRQAVYNPADASTAPGPYLSQFGNLVGASPIFGPDPDGTGPLRRPLLGFGAPTVFSGPTGNYNRGIAYLGRRNVEGGGREDHLERSSWRIVGGIRGDLLKGLSYDAYYQFGTTRFSQAFLNDFSIRRLNMALDVVANPAVGGVSGVAAGTPVCRAALPGTGPGGGALDPNCVPYDVFATGGVSPQALAYLQTPLLSRGNVNETIANANITVDGGEYGVQTPWSDRGIGLNFGGEYRKEALDFLPDIQFQSGDGAGQGGAIVPVSGHFDVREAFAELQIPIVSRSFFEELTLGAGYRYSDYKVAGNHFNTDTYKLSVEFAPIHDIRARASYNRAVRAPNVVELFAPQAVGLGGTVDPCAGPNVGGNIGGPNGPTAVQCANTGVTAAQFGSIQPNPANQYNALIGGNPNLAPEKADTYTVGLVVQPRFVPGLAFTLDYFDIKVEGLISTLGFQTIMSQCLASGDPFFCSKIHRMPSNGSLWLTPAGFIETTNVNIGGLRTKGFDFNGSYSRRLGGIGTVNVSYVGTMLRKLVIDTGVTGSGTGQDGKFDCAGLYGSTCGSFLSGAPNPKYRHKLRLGLTMKNGLGISGQWRYFSSVKNDGLEADCDISATATCTGDVADANRHIKAQSFFDLAMTARLADRYNFRLGVNNLLDKEPPIVGGEVSNAPFGNGNTFPQVYDALGRFLFAGVTVDF